MMKLLFFGTLLLSAFGYAYGNGASFVPKVVITSNKDKVSQTLRSERVDEQSKSSILAGSITNNYATSPSKPRLVLDTSKVEVESDGSYSLKTFQSIDVLAALNSGIGTAVNFEIQFAKNSLVLTADGKQTLGLIADAISYLNSDIRIDLEIPKHPVKEEAFTKARGNELLRLLHSRYGVKNPIKLFITPSNSKAGFYSAKGQDKVTDIKRITILNMGKVNNN